MWWTFFVILLVWSRPIPMSVGIPLFTKPVTGIFHGFVRSMPLNRWCSRNLVVVKVLCGVNIILQTVLCKRGIIKLPSFPTRKNFYRIFIHFLFISFSISSWLSRQERYTLLSQMPTAAIKKKLTVSVSCGNLTSGNKQLPSRLKSAYSWQAIISLQIRKLWDVLGKLGKFCYQSM